MDRTPLATRLGTVPSGSVVLGERWRYSRLLSASAPLACLALMGAWVGLEDAVARWTNDDQSYYIMVARNLFSRGPTYDGIYLTNGVHPLFALVLGSVYWLGSIGFADLATVSVLLCAGFGCALLYVLLGLRPLSNSTRLSLIVTLSSLAVYPILYRGMEGSLALWVLALFMSSVARDKVSFGVASALSIALWAARIELLAFPPIVILLGGRALGWTREQRDRWIAAWLTSVLAFAVFAAVSYHWIGLALPVSGLIKQGDPRLLPYFLALGLVCASLALGLALHPALRNLARRAWMTHSLLGGAAVFYLAHAFGQQDTERQTWYYFLLPALLAFALVEVDLRASARRWISAGLAGMALMALLWEGSFVIPLRGDSWRAMQSIAARAKQAASPGERFMGPGWMSLLVGPEFEPFSSDGLVGGVEQYRALREGRQLEFAYESGVRFVFMSDAASALEAPRLPEPWQLSLVSEGAVPNGGSLWAWLSGGDPVCGIGRCESMVAVFRLSRSDAGDLRASRLDAVRSAPR